jgi:hypothetical protein
MARRVLNVAILEMRLDRARVVTIVGKIVATAMAEHVGVPLMPRSAAMAARSTMREKPSADAALRNEKEWRPTLALVAAELPHFSSAQRVRRTRAVLGARNVQGCVF